MLHCPSCLLDKIKKNGHTHYGKQNFRRFAGGAQPLRCKLCGPQFVEGSTHYISKQKRSYIEAALIERLSLRGICRVFQVSLSWLQHFAHSLWQQVPSDLGTRLPGNNRQLRLQFAAIQIDELWRPPPLALGGSTKPRKAVVSLNNTGLGELWPRRRSDGLSSRISSGGRLPNW